MQFLEQSTAVTLKIGPFLDSTDGNTVEGGLTLTQADVRLSKNGGNIAQKNEASACTHDELGIYGCPVNATDTNTLGRLQLWVHESGALQVWHEYMVVPSNVWDSLFGSDKLQVDTTQIEGVDATDQIRDSVVDDATRIDASQLNTHSAITAAGIINEWETQSQADPTGFHVNVKEVDGTAQTANDNGADINAILTDTNELQTDWTNGGRLDLILDAILADTGTDGVIVSELKAAALADFFNTDSGDTYAGSVAGSVVKEIADAASGATADQLWDEEMDANAPATCNTAREYMNVMVAGMAGPTADEEDWSAQDLGETKTRIAATLDDEGHRTSIDTLDGT